MILSILGIILATASALLVIDYGGDYYIDVQRDAKAAEMRNVLDQVAAAHQTYEMHYLEKATSTADIVSAGILNETPRPSLGTYDPVYLSIDYNGTAHRALSINSLPQELCARLNEIAGFSTNWGDGKPASTTSQFGCYTATATGDGTFFRILDAE